MNIHESTRRNVRCRIDASISEFQLAFRTYICSYYNGHYPSRLIVRVSCLAIRIKYKLNFDGSDCGGKKCKRGHGGACGGDWRQYDFSWRKDSFTCYILFFFKKNINFILSIRFAKIILK